jgi:hypothetical protein
MGFISMQITSSGTRNSAYGAYSMAQNTTGQFNNSFGDVSLYSNTTGSNNNAFGLSALENNTTGGSNTAIGNEALKANTTASNNTAVGYQAGNNITTGGGNTYVGVVSASGGGAASELVVGTPGATGKGNNTGFIYAGGGGVYQGNNSSTWSTTSDQRLKKNIVDNKTGLDVISQIQVRNFEYRIADEVTDLPKDQVINKAGLQLGVIAQELQAVLPECVKEESTGVLTVDTDNLTWYLINAVKELKAEIDQLKGK